MHVCTQSLTGVAQSVPSKPSLQVRQVQVLGVKVSQLGFWQSSHVAPFNE